MPNFTVNLQKNDNRSFSINFSLKFAFHKTISRKSINGKFKKIVIIIKFYNLQYGLQQFKGQNGMNGKFAFFLITKRSEF